MSDIRNTIQLIGNLGSDPEIKTTTNGRKMGRVSLATNESFTNKDGEQVKRTHWHNLIAWGPQADYLEKYLQKGSYVGVRGRISRRTYEAKDGTKRTHTEVIVREFLSLSKKDVPL
jgi:single-strand DNA-binding protein